jgi:adenosylcobinamide-phosphate synthase
VGRDTTQLSPQQIRIAVLETMSENLSDGVIAPLFYYVLAGLPGMMTYKMINTMDSMLGYRNHRYEQFGKVAARLDDIANFLPARLTALLMVLVTGCWQGLVFTLKYGHQHKSPNAGYPEAALAGILNCRFGGPNLYQGVLVDKPYIGKQERPIGHEEIHRVRRVNHSTCLLMVAGIILFTLLALK